MIADEEHALLAEIAKTRDPHASIAIYSVYADKLEEDGDLERAQFLRMEIALRAHTGTDDEKKQLALRMLDLGTTIAARARSWFVQLPHPVIRGATWKGWASNGDGPYFTARFLENGKLNYQQTDTAYENGTWQQDGILVGFEMNRRYAEYDGMILGGAIYGRGKNITRATWEFYLAPTEVAAVSPEQTDTTIYAWADPAGDPPRRGRTAKNKTKPAKPATKKPATKKPATKKLATKKPATKAKPVNKSASAKKRPAIKAKKPTRKR